MTFIACNLVLVGLVTHPALCVAGLCSFIISLISYIKSSSVSGSYEDTGWLDFKESDVNKDSNVI